jgi:hypothetical protein
MSVLWAQTLSYLTPTPNVRADCLPYIFESNSQPIKNILVRRVGIEPTLNGL